MSKEKAERVYHSAFTNLEDPASDGLAMTGLKSADLSGVVPVLRISSATEGGLTKTEASVKADSPKKQL